MIADQLTDMEADDKYNIQQIAAFLLVLLLIVANRGAAKSYIESCSAADKCSAFVSYRLPTFFKLGDIASMFNVNILGLLGANDFDLTQPHPEQVLLRPKQLVKIPVSCGCSDGIRQVDYIFYEVRSADSIQSIANDVFGGIVTPQQIEQANNISNSFSVSVGESIIIPFSCACNGNVFNNIPTIFVTYAVQAEDTTSSVAQAFGTAVSNLETLNDLQNFTTIVAGDIIAIPIAACTSSFRPIAADYGLIVANGTYVTTAANCIQCGCASIYLEVYCTPLPLVVNAACPSETCSGTSLNIGESDDSQSLDGCQVQSCLYDGFQQSTIFSRLQSASLPICPVAPPLPAYQPFVASPVPTTVPRPPVEAPEKSSPQEGPIQSSAYCSISRACFIQLLITLWFSLLAHF
ncbi:hypothetical protein O6H91_05G064200 [Diphasiastrum complanatum]|uniref:Uncharacterized protein n=3 Tax=Diphasiastrum complanatum TaxID=34168 RepID=A0ACC2DPE0_DIPCM|nr:hypothetical protein O6H91_Y238300 [Diphasiastrum complanatum]KAJ7294714.1 hypothetical protein O6H91_Y238300 [Diphasiastrum complanatum]KAJ7294715.1 hypothetical protein O6H91_Y238300 [Diphasiastrum complanatum]KAJ7555982.1 hypothetical protein O6H91_05G064200 [Diphasiastrum complanatum]KAJ7555983.1 hypothetical protein O6H91_05G064200 [Diphasiastrum complanatum]